MAEGGDIAARATAGRGFGRCAGRMFSVHRENHVTGTLPVFRCCDVVRLPGNSMHASAHRSASSKGDHLNHLETLYMVAGAAQATATRPPRLARSATDAGAATAPPVVEQALAAQAGAAEATTSSRLHSASVAPANLSSIASHTSPAAGAAGTTSVTPERNAAIRVVMVPYAAPVTSLPTTTKLESGAAAQATGAVPAASASLTLGAAAKPATVAPSPSPATVVATSSNNGKGATPSGPAKSSATGTAAALASGTRMKGAAGACFRSRP